MDLERFITTYRYLRVTVVALVALLAVAVLRQLVADGWALHPSISDYYYTPARGVFVAVLVAIGAGMIVIKGNTGWEDTFLNVAGLLAPVVAFVPTPAQDSCTGGRGVSGATADAIANNVLALIVVGGAGLVAAYLFARRSTTPLAVRRPTGGGLLIAAGFWTAFTAWFLLGRDSFSCGAHNTAAITMFGFIVLVVAWNAWGSAGRSARRAVRTRYGLLAVLMLATAVGLGLLALVIDNGVFWLEAVLIAEFAGFWVLQSQELWGRGLRAEP